MLRQTALAIAVTTILVTGGTSSTQSVTLDEVPKQEQQIVKPKSVEELVTVYAQKYNVSAVKMMATIRCENRDLDPKLQSKMHYTKDHPEWGVKKGEREKSFGLVQIHLPDHPETSYAQATDPEYSIEFMAKKFSEGHGHEWSCY